jgi:hypothetical protein
MTKKKIESKTVLQHQEAFIALYRDRYCKPLECVRLLRMSAATYYSWRHEYPSFVESMEQVDNEKIEQTAASYFNTYVSAKSRKRSRQGQEFWLKTKGKNHGFTEKTEIEGSLPQGPRSLQINFIVVNPPPQQLTKETECQVLPDQQKNS